MPKLPPVRNTIFNEPYEALSRMRSDGFTVQHFNSSESKSYFPGEPLLKLQGNDAYVVLAQGEIPPGEWRAVVRQWEAVFPCDLSANVKDGDPIYWDVDTEKASLSGDVTNGFLLGAASFATEPGERIFADPDDRNVVATSASTEIQVVYVPAPTEIIGDVDYPGVEEGSSSE